MTVAFVALLAALSGTAVALPGKNTVDSGDIKNRQVKSADIKNNSVLSKDIKNNSVRGKDIRSNTVKGSDVSESSLGKVPSAATADTAGNALFATIAPASAAAAVVRGRGVTGVARVGTGFYDVTFDRSVAGCTWLATYGQPDTSGVDAVWATVRGPSIAGATNKVGVVLRNAAGAQADGNGFHIQAICP